MSSVRYTFKINQGETFYRRVTQLQEEFSETLAELDAGQHGRIIVTEVGGWGGVLNDFSSRYARMKIRDATDDSIITVLNEANARLLNKREDGTLILHLNAQETAALDFTRGVYDIELLQHSLSSACQASSGDPYDVDVSNPGVIASTVSYAADAEDTGTGGDVAWSNPDNAKVVAGYTDAVLTSDNSNYLELTHFDPIAASPVWPAERATVSGIEVIINRKRSDGGSDEIKDVIVQLMKDGAVVGDNKADTSTNWTASQTSITYPAASGSTDLWGTTWDMWDIVNNEGFGVRIQVQDNATDSTAFIYYVTVTVHFKDVGIITATATPFSGYSAGDYIYVQDSESSNEGIYRLAAATTQVLTTTTPLQGSDNADDEAINISKITFDETEVVRLMDGSIVFKTEATY